MKTIAKVVILVLAAVMLCLNLAGCIVLVLGDEETATETETDAETTAFGLTEKEIEVIEDIIKKPRDDMAEIIRLGYDKMYVNGEWVEAKHLIEYKIVFKNGDTQLVSINTMLLE